jgi:hypothetical protein
MKRNALIAVVITAAATLALGGPAFAKYGHGNGNGGSNGGNVPTTAPKPTIHPNQAVKDAIHCAFHCGTIEEDDGIEGGN